ncbi:hypothetical protein SAMD00019534_026920 [Acytostelium subglobosum LB1]|uniref:hypothetical protein n=1 Tax=Acytostelium subglobosum LB1 TaxID=1410327 RepID=UPI000644BA8D|nr:hypothetical protein SAMD00019534_026920 [Acytostelium subglobosum LB1]GAM19517.1 hypothetical protein SAMD00019534_026920 [Acytostelium subglobosum LB1]|eukprot:XP_012757444.1 hypothetical protein SAMD00019534_026920 [Acytostelium subglobosum LB1]
MKEIEYPAKVSKRPAQKKKEDRDVKLQIKKQMIQQELLKSSSKQSPPIDSSPLSWTLTTPATSSSSTFPSTSTSTTSTTLTTTTTTTSTSTSPSSPIDLDKVRFAIRNYYFKTHQVSPTQPKVASFKMIAVDPQGRSKRAKTNHPPSTEVAGIPPLPPESHPPQSSSSSSSTQSKKKRKKEDN